MPRNKKNNKKSNPNKKNQKSKAAKAQADVKARPPYKSGANNRRSIMPRATSNTMSNSIKSSKAVHEMVCSVTDPFCYKARLAKWPDGQGGGTLAMQIRGRAPLLNLGTAGGNLIQFAGMLPYAYFNAASFATSTYTMSSTWFTVAAPDFAVYASTYRIVTWGIIIRNVQPANTASGTVIIRKLTRPADTGTTQPQGSMYGSEVTEVPIYPGMETSVVAKPSGNVSRNFASQNVPNGSTTNTGWDFIQVEVLNNSGAAATIVLDVEYVYNVEVTLFSTYQSMHEFIPPSAPANAVVTSAASAVINKASTIVEGGVKAIGSHVLSKVEDFFEAAGTDLLAMLPF
jgi:hypothetical protein